MTNKTKLMYIGLFVGIGVVLLIVIFASFRANKKSTQLQPLSPTPTTAIEQPQPNKNVYSPKASDSVIDKVENRQALSQADLQIKQAIVNSLTPSEENVYTSSTFVVSYVNPPDIFQVEILSDDAESAKQDAVQWFLSKGFSQDALCKLPVQFYLNFSVLQDFKVSGKTFSEVAPGC